MAPWTEWIARPDDGEWTLACQHSSVTSEAVKSTYSPDQALTLYALLRSEYPDFTPEETALVAIRLMLGMLLKDQIGCSCAQRPFQIEQDDSGGWRVEDLAQ